MIRFAFIGLSIILAVSSRISLPASADTICADDTVPEGMAITATGTAADCAGACRARTTEAVCGPLMKICANQPIPRGYVLDGITSMPACQCLGSDDNGYVIRYVGMRGESGLWNSSAEDADVNPYVDAQMVPGLSKSDPGEPYGNPPFGNLLCRNMPRETEPTDNAPYIPSTNNVNSYPAQLPSRDGRATPTHSWDYQQSEPFRVGQ
jgi:hypothetical protein